MRYKGKKRTLCAEVVREIALDEVTRFGPLSLCELERVIESVFGPGSTNIAILASALCKERSGLAVIEGVIDTCPRGLSPLPRHESLRRAKKADQAKRIKARKS